MFAQINPYDAVIWAIVIFIAGFIGYFGKYLSKLVLRKIHKGGPENKPKEGASTKEAPEKKSKEELEYDLEKKRLKLEKKRLKAEKKRAKQK